MKPLYINEERAFLSEAVVDYVSLHNLYGIIAGSFERLIPTPKEFGELVNFISFLFSKYEDNLVCLEGSDMKPTHKSPKELIAWLRETYDKGKYSHIHYGIWFDLDEKAIPEKYKLKPIPEREQ